MGAGAIAGIDAIIDAAGVAGAEVGAMAWNIEDGME